MGYGCKDSAKFRLNEENANIFVFLSGRNLFKSSEIPKENLFFFELFPPKKYPLWCVSKSKNDMVPFGRNPKSALSEQRSSDQQMGGEQQDECRPRRAEDVNGSVHVHCCFIYCLYLIQYIGLAHHKRKPPSASFGMSRRILSCGKGNRKGGYKYFATNSVGESISMVEVSAAL